eukprot:s640_g22.t1
MPKYIEDDLVDSDVFLTRHGARIDKEDRHWLSKAGHRRDDLQLSENNAPRKPLLLLLGHPLTPLSVVAMGGCAGKTADAPKPGNKTGSSMPKKEIKEGGIGHAQFIIENTGKITPKPTLNKP